MPIISNLLFLNLLICGETRSYQIKDVLSLSEGFIAGIKKGTSYNILQMLERYGHIIASVEHEGNRLGRRVYESTGPRCKAFKSTLRKPFQSSAFSLPDQIKLVH